MYRFTLGCVLALVAVGAQASRCECEYDDWIGDCTATVESRGNWVKLTSSSDQCSRIDWYANGNPHVTVVTEGTATEELLNYTGEIKLAVQSCKICKDRMYAEGGPPGTSEQRAQPTADATGIWQGSYAYRDGRGSVNFEWNLKDVNGVISGRSSEPNTMSKSGSTLGARLSGTRSGDTVRLTKQYDGSGGQDHSVQYEGRLQGDTLSGTWATGGISGTFQVRNTRSAIHID